MQRVCIAFAGSRNKDLTEFKFLMKQAENLNILEYFKNCDAKNSLGELVYIS